MTNHLHYKTCNKTLIRKTLLLLFIWVWNAKMQPPRVEKFGKINPKSEGWHYRFNLNNQISKISSIFLKKLKCLTPVFCHFRGVGFLQLFTKSSYNGSNCIFSSPLCNKWLILAIFRIFHENWRKHSPLKWQNKGVKHFKICYLTLFR